MKKLFYSVTICLLLFSCNNNSEKGRFTVNGDVKNIPDQKIYLEEMFFSQKDPEVLDTAVIKNGKFSISAIAPEQGLYRLRFEKERMGYIFINDLPSIKFITDGKDLTGDATSFSTPANASLMNFLKALNAQRLELERAAAQIGFNKANQEKAGQSNSENLDSIIAVETADQIKMIERSKQFVIKYIDTTSNPVNALFALGYIRDIEPHLVENPIANLINRFPNHKAVGTIVAQFNKMMEDRKAQEEAKNKYPQIGSLAPDITMNDVNDKPFSLSELRGKYVLVDFWASWCGPCRGENPNVVAAYKKFKDKNFTVLGVSLDKNKDQWVQAIADDKLTWKHISDLKYWSSAAVELYGFDSIPYNVLVDPDGKIIGIGLRGEALESKLEEVLK